MKQLLSVFALMMCFSCFGQAPVSYIKPMAIELAANKTTNIVFPFAIQHVDMGSSDVLSQTVGGAVNVLELKAARDSFPETNVSVVTNDGKLYSFVANYAALPGELNIVIGRGVASDVSSAAHAAVLQPVSLHGGHDAHDAIHVRLSGLYVQNDVFYFRLQFSNYASVSYDVADVRFSVLDKHKGKRTARQETLLEPVYTTMPVIAVGAGQKPVAVFALPKFTLQDGKYLRVHITEKDGGRDLVLRVTNRVLVRAMVIKALHVL